MIGVCGTIFAEGSEAFAECNIVDALQIGIGAQRDFLDVLRVGRGNLITESFDCNDTKLA